MVGFGSASEKYTPVNGRALYEIPAGHGGCPGFLHTGARARADQGREEARRHGGDANGKREGIKRDRTPSGP
jgi:hypothetical protein